MLDRSRPKGRLLLNILLRKRDTPAALREFQEYLRLEPNGPMAPPTRDMVAKIAKALASYVDNAIAGLSLTIDRSFSRFG